MPFPTKVQTAINKYDQQKGFFRRLFGDQRGIKRLKRLPAVDQNDPFKMAMCFYDSIQYSSQASYAVYLTISYELNLKHITHTRFNDAFNMLQGLVVEDNSSYVTGFYDDTNFSDASFALRAFLDASILDQEVFEAVVIHDNPIRVLSAANFLRPPNLFNKKNIKYLLRHKNLLAAKGIWQRIPTHLMIQLVFDQLAILSQQEDAIPAINAYVNHILNGETRDNINHQQSTHSNSVEKSALASAKRLLQSYSTKTSGSQLERIIKEMQWDIQSLPTDNVKNSAANRCLQRLLNNSHLTINSNISIIKLFASGYLAIQDSEKRIGTYADAFVQFVDALYQIQRGYNLSDQGVDQRGSDKPICMSGTVNKLIEKLQGICPDCEIVFVTHSTASLKVPRLACEEAMRHLGALSSPQTMRGFQAWIHLMVALKNEGIIVIWSSIKDAVTNRFFDEFQSLYESKNDTKLVEVISSCEYVSLENLEFFQKSIGDSEGYQKYCGHILRRSIGLFASPILPVDYNTPAVLNRSKNNQLSCQ